MEEELEKFGDWLLENAVILQDDIGLCWFYEGTFYNTGAMVLIYTMEFKNKNNEKTT